MIDFFKKLQNEAAKAGSAQLSLLATHPPTDERISRLEAKWKALGKREFPALPAPAEK